jgi:hypothetical protein
VSAHEEDAFTLPAVPAFPGLAAAAAEHLQLTRAEEHLRATKARASEAKNKLEALEAKLRELEAREARDFADLAAEKLKASAELAKAREALVLAEGAVRGATGSVLRTAIAASRAETKIVRAYETQLSEWKERALDPVLEKISAAIAGRRAAVFQGAPNDVQSGTTGIADESGHAWLTKAVVDRLRTLGVAVPERIGAPPIVIDTSLRASEARGEPRLVTCPRCEGSTTRVDCTLCDQRGVTDPDTAEKFLAARRPKVPRSAETAA